jgi:hypothetical protein
MIMSRHSGGRPNIPLGMVMVVSLSVVMVMMLLTLLLAKPRTDDVRCYKIMKGLLNLLCPLFRDPENGI